MNNTYECFCCGTKIRCDELPDAQVVGTADNALWFRASGNFGSEIFDPITDEEFLQIVICDKCVMERSKRVVRVIADDCPECNNDTYTRHPFNE